MTTVAPAPIRRATDRAALRLLVVHNRYRSGQPSGENSVVDDEVELLAQAGIDVEQLTVESDDIAGWSRARRATLPSQVVWSNGGTRLLARALQKHRPSVVHFHNTFPLLSPAALRVPHAHDVPAVQTLHNFRPLCAAATFLRDGEPCELCVTRRYVPALRHGCYRRSRAATAPVVAMNAVHDLAGTWKRAIDRFVVPSQFALEKYRAAGWSVDNFVVKPNSVVVEAPPAVTKRSGFACVARLTPEKGVETLIEAWRMDPSDVLTVVGGGDDAQRISDLARGVTNLRFAGQQDRAGTLQHVASARALIVPSRCYEVAPRVVVEAFALGVPVIASRIGSLPELVQHEENGLLVDTRSPTAFADAARRIATDDRLAKRLGAGAARAFRTTFAPEATTRRLIDLYESVRRDDFGGTR